MIVSIFFFFSYTCACLNNITTTGPESPAEILNLSERGFHYSIFFFLPKFSYWWRSPQKSWCLLDSSPSKSSGQLLPHLLRTDQDSASASEIECEQRSLHLLSPEVFLFEQWLLLADGKSHSKTICVRGGKKAQGKCQVHHAACRNSLKSFENFFWKVWWIQDSGSSPHLLKKKISEQLIFFLCMYNASRSSCDRAAGFKGCQDQLLTFFITSCDEQFVQKETCLLLTLTQNTVYSFDISKV